MKTTNPALLLSTCLIAAPLSANAVPVTFDFTGSVTVASGIYSSVSIGAAVSGTYTFDFANADPSQSSGTVGSTTSSWTSQIFGGSFFFGAPTPVTSRVFSSTATVGGFTYESAPPTTFETSSRILANVFPINSQYQATEGSCVDFIHCHSSSLIGGALFGIDYTNQGLPLFNVGGWTGQFSVNSSATFDDFLRFEITALTPAVTVPEPATLALIVFGFVGIGFARIKRKN